MCLPSFLNTKTFWKNYSSFRHETLSGERVAILNRKLARSIRFTKCLMFARNVKSDDSAATNFLPIPGLAWYVGQTFLFRSSDGREIAAVTIRHQSSGKIIS
jgi:hypothetical protein